MTETPPAPADDHTGTDRVELTDATLDQWATLSENATPGPWVVDYGEASHGRYVKRVFHGGIGEFAVADTAEPNSEFIAVARTAVPQLIEAVKESRARLQALTTERDELRASLPKRTRDWLAHCKVLDAERDAVSDQLAEAWKQLGETEAERDALQATLERVTALADEWDFIASHGGSFTPEYRIHELRAALTPEGSE